MSEKGWEIFCIDNNQSSSSSNSLTDFVEKGHVLQLLEMSVTLDAGIELMTLDLPTKREILRQLWSINDQNISGDLNYEVCFKFYKDQCQKALSDRGRYASVRSHQDILDIAQYIKNDVHRDAIKQFIISKLSVPHPTNANE